MISAVNSYNYQQYSGRYPGRINFTGYTNEMLRAVRKTNNIPEYINAAYSGYSGPKKFNFPTDINLDLNNYPDITEEFAKLKAEILAEVKSAKKGLLGKIKILKLFLKNFSTGNCWDTKYLPEFPGRDIKGKTQYGKYKDKVVSANYVSNNIYGQACAAADLTVYSAKTAAKIDAFGALELLTKQRLPNKELIKFRDTDCDQRAIEIGYHDFFKNEP